MWTTIALAMFVNTIPAQSPPTPTIRLDLTRTTVSSQSMFRPSVSSSVQQRSWPRRHPVWLGMAVGGGVGAAWGAATYPEGTDSLGGRGGNTLIGAGIGVVVGTLGGFLVGWATK